MKDDSDIKLNADDNRSREGFVGQVGVFVKTAEEKLTKIAEISTKIDELFGRATESQAKADNEALRANQAKLMVEEHSNAVAKIKGQLDADAATISSRKTEIEQLIQTLSNLRKSSESDASSIASSRKSVDEIGKLVAESSGRITGIQSNVEEVKKGLDAIAQAAREQGKAVDTNSSKISVAAEKAETVVAQIDSSVQEVKELHEHIKTAKGAVELLEKDAKIKLESMSELTGRGEAMSANVKEYEETLSVLEREFKDVRSKVEALLPGAASASLASSFATQKNRFATPQKFWKTSFIGCIGLLLIVAGIGGLGTLSGTEPSTWDSIFRHFVQRLPYVIPLVWLGVYSGRQYMLSLRMEEEYAFKEATSTAFEGYKREMASIPEGMTGNGAPLNTLCNNVLASLYRRPGLIYEGKHHDVTPLTPAIDAAEKLVPAVGRALGRDAKKNIPSMPADIE